jgi:hypothetical protein
MYQSLFPCAARKIRRIARGKRFLEGFVHFFFQVPISIFDFLVGSIRAHGIPSINPHLFRGCKNHAQPLDEILI